MTSTDPSASAPPPARLHPATMKKISFGFFDDSGQPRQSRILMFYSFETDQSLARSGILHYHVAEKRFLGPRHDPEITNAALEFLQKSGRLDDAS